MSNSLLLHCCCAHCTAYTVEYWRGKGYDVSGFWYNPNIHPYTEHLKRLDSIRDLSKTMQFPLISVDSYDMPEYFRNVAGNEQKRCDICFQLRLNRTAVKSKEDGFDNFSSTLLISPHQKHELIKITGEQIARKVQISFLYADLRKRFSDSRHITKPMNLYRQQYCGCVYSEYERYEDSRG